MADVTGDDCAQACVAETDFLCRSFDVNNAKRMCLLFAVDDEDSDVRLIPDENTDHYQGIWYKALPSFHAKTFVLSFIIFYQKRYLDSYWEVERGACAKFLWVNQRGVKSFDYSMIVYIEKMKTCSYE